MLNQNAKPKNLEKTKKNKKTILRDSWLDPPKSEKPKNQKNLGKTKKTKKNNSGEVLRKRGSSQESLRIVFFCFFGFPKVFMVFWFFFMFFLMCFFILYAYLLVFFGFDCGTDAFT